jgi:hypothetical protein
LVLFLRVIILSKLDKILHAAMRSITAAREFTTDLHGTSKSTPKLSTSAA